MANKDIVIIRKVMPNTGVRVATVHTQAEANAVINDYVEQDLASMRAIWGNKVEGPIKGAEPTKGLPDVPSYTLMVREGKSLPNGLREFIFAIEYWGYLPSNSTD